MNAKVLSLLAGVLSLTAVQENPVPLVDHHYHLFNTTMTQVTPGLQPITASDAVRALDRAGVRRAVLLSVAYQFGNPNRPAVPNEYVAVQAENDRVSREVARYPDRFRGFCGVNPLKEYALAEIARCATDPYLRFGVKLHFGNSDVDLENMEHRARVREVFRVANASRMAIVVHMRPSVTMRRPYGAAVARTFLAEILPAAPDVPVQIAHLTGSGGYDEPGTDEAVAVFVDAIAKHDSRMAHVYFDLSGIAGLGRWQERAGLVATRIRQLGIDRMLFGSDSGTKEMPGTREAWAAVRQLPLTDAEFRTIASNIAPYMK
jgi:predicted TIM-barrel fold metal-dependent hydrolase